MAAEPPGVEPPAEIKGDGITLTVSADGQIRLQTEDLWKGAVDTTYSDCTFYRNAVPILERQLSAERAALLTQVCKGSAAAIP